jgi:hypothetical protein
MKLVFRKYMEFEHNLGNEKQISSLRARVEEYLSKTFKEEKAEDEEMSEASGSQKSEESEESDGESDEQSQSSDD